MELKVLTRGGQIQQPEMLLLSVATEQHLYSTLMNLSEANYVWQQSGAKDLPLELLHMISYSHQAESDKPEQEDCSTAK